MSERSYQTPIRAYLSVKLTKGSIVHICVDRISHITELSEDRSVIVLDTGATFEANVAGKYLVSVLTRKNQND